MSQANGQPEARGVRAAQYLRMSTDHQRFSIENQQAAIKRFADANDIQIVKEYVDRGKSGLSTKGREGLLSLLADVREGKADFALLLVYDVSRWGRFQDPDESAYYEFICRSAGVHVHYCAERFENDNSPMSAVLKNLKRAMAAEYSRELSEKVFRGLVKTAQSGFNPGGHPGFGLRRLLLDVDGKPQRLLEHGQRKALASDRVTIVPGPAEEIEVVQSVFHLYAHDRCSMATIVEVLNERGLMPGPGRRWNSQIVERLLRNERYLGVLTFNRTSQKLRRKQRLNPPDEWVRGRFGFEPIVDPELFAAAQAALRSQRWRHQPDEELLERLRDTWKRWGILSENIIGADLTLPSVKTLRTRFGSVSTAYEMIGYQPPPWTLSGELRGKEVRLRLEHMKRLRKDSHRLNIGSVKTNHHEHVIKYANGTTVRVLVLRARVTSNEWTVWCWRANQLGREDFVLLVRLDRRNIRVFDRHLLPRAILERRKTKIIIDNDPTSFLSPYRISRISEVGIAVATRQGPAN